MPKAVHRSPIGRRWTAKGDARCRPHGRHIPRFAASGKARSFCRSSSSHRNRFRWVSAGTLLWEGTFSLCRKLQPFPQTRRKLVADSEVECLPDRGGNSRQIVSCGLTRVDRVNPWRVDTFGTVQLDDALSVAAAQTGCNTDLS